MRSIMRRILPLMLLAAILLGACAPAVTLFTHEPDVSPSPEPALASTPLPPTAIPGPTSPPDLGVSALALRGVEVLVWHGWDGSSANLFAHMAGDFTSSNEWGIIVKTVARSNLNLLTSEVDKALRTPDQPDIVVTLPEQILAWQENVVDLSPYLAQPEYGLDVGDISGAFWEQSHINGVRYAVPAARSARFLFYNLSFARDLGFEAAPQTTEDFRKQTCAANAFWKQDTDLTNDRFGGLALDVTSNWQTPFSWLAAGGGQVFADGELRFDTPENLDALKFVSDLREDGCAWQESPTWTAETISNLTLFSTRRALIISGSLGDFAGQRLALSEAGSADAWTVLPFPGTKPGFVAYGPDYAVLKSTGVRQLAAWLFIRWMLDEQNQVKWAQGTGLLPVTTSAVKVLEADGSSIPQWVAAMRLIPLAQPYPQTASWRVADKILADGFQAYFASFPNASLTDVFKTIDSTIADLPK